MIDNETDSHLQAWIEKCIPEEEQDEAYSLIITHLTNLHEEDLKRALDLSWRKVLDEARGV